MGFTLIEMMVVIGIIAILSSFVVPGIKKAYDDFKLRQTYDNINIVMQAMRSYYLIFNETAHPHYGASISMVAVKATPFFPAGWVDKSYISRWESQDRGIPETDFCKLILPPIYLFSRGTFQVGYWGFRTVTNKKPYYWDDLLDMCAKKNYHTRVGVEGPNFYYFYLPEKHDAKWFQ